MTTLFVVERVNQNIKQKDMQQKERETKMLEMWNQNQLATHCDNEVCVRSRGGFLDRIGQAGG